jgi:hypothetical protein
MFNIVDLTSRLVAGKTLFKFLEAVHIVTDVYKGFKNDGSTFTYDTFKASAVDKLFNLVFPQAQSELLEDLVYYIFSAVGIVKRLLGK